MRMLKLFGMIAAAAVITTSANATPLSDNFEGENSGTPMLNYFGLTNFYVSNAGTGGSIDLIGTGTGGSSYDFYPGHGLYVDICGTTSSCGVLTTSQIFAAGTYDVSISLGGNFRYGTPTGTTIDFGDYSNTIMLSQFELYTLNFTTTLLSSSALSIGDLGLDASNIGNLLFSVDIAEARIADVDTRVPEPISLSLFGAGLLGAAAMRRRKLATA